MENLIKHTPVCHQSVFPEFTDPDVQLLNPPYGTGNGSCPSGQPQYGSETPPIVLRPAGPARPHAVSAEGEWFMQALLRQEVDLTLEQLRHHYADVYGITVSLGALHAALKRLDITRKKVHLRPETEHGGRASRNRSPASTRFPLTNNSTSMKPELA